MQNTVVLTGRLAELTNPLSRDKLTAKYIRHCGLLSEHVAQYHVLCFYFDMRALWLAKTQ